VAVDGLYIYWANQTGSIGRANLDGSGVDPSFMTGVVDPFGVAVDGLYIYWANQTGSIGRANLDGSDPDATFVTGAHLPTGVAVDGSYLYWANDGSGTIGRANLDGSSPNQSFVTDANGIVGLTEETPEAPSVPTSASAVAGNGEAIVTFTAPFSDGGSAITSYTVTASPGGLTATGSSSPLAVRGLTNGTTYTFTVTGTNGIGASLPSVPSNAVTPSGVPALYWTTVGPETIGTANLDGSGFDQNLITGAGTPFAVAVSGQHLYWANGSGGTISEANLDGSDVDPSFVTGATSAFGVAVDGQYVYWTDEAGNAIGRANLDGSGVDETFITGADSAYQVAVDGQYIYWTDPAGNSIGRAKLNGTAVNRSFITGLADPHGLTVDAAHIYWTDGDVAGEVGRANLDGTGVDETFITGAHLPVGVAVDGSYVYWANDGSGTIGRANLDGSSPNQSFISGSFGIVGLTESVPLRPDHFDVGLSATSVAAGQTFTVTITARDAANRTLANYAGPVTLSDTSGSLSVTGPVVWSDGVGVATVSVAIAISRDRVTATDLTFAPPRTGTSTSVVAVTSPVLDHFHFSGLPATLSTGGPVSFQLTALDAGSQVIQGFTGPLSLSDTTGTLSVGSVVWLDGVATVTVSVGAATTRDRITAVSGTVSDVSGVFNVLGPVASLRVALSPLTASVTHGTPVTVTVTAVDSAGQVVSGYTGPVTLTDTSTHMTVTALPVWLSGTGTFQVSFSALITRDRVLAVDDAGDSGQSAVFAVV
jgi:virginiamycin B lyase